MASRRFSGLPVMPGNVLTGNGWWQSIDPKKMEEEPDQAPEWAVLQTASGRNLSIGSGHPKIGATVARCATS